MEKDTFVKIEGQKFAYKAQNITRADGWIAFDRVNTKTGEISHLEFPLNKVESIEVR